MCAKPGGTLAPHTEQNSNFGAKMDASGCWQIPTAEGLRKPLTDLSPTITSGREAGVEVSNGTSEDTKSEIDTAGNDATTADLASGTIVNCAGAGKRAGTGTTANACSDGQLVLISDTN
jgi:hypothetical protein